MPWTQINLGDQHSQEMTIKHIRDNYLVCTMDGFDSSYAVNAVSTDVSRPAGLRRMDYDGSGAYSYHHANTRKILSGDASGEYELVTPVYNTGEKIYVTKMVSSPMDTSGNSFTTDLLANSTVDIFIDENRAGRSWVAAGGSGGLPSGYKPKCIVFCEDGTEISGQILFKSGCDDTDEGVSQAAATLEAGVISAEEGFDTNLYYGPKSTDTYNSHDGSAVGTTLTWFNGVGDSIKGFTGQPISDSEELVKYEEDETAWRAVVYATPGLAKNYLSAALPETELTAGTINSSQSSNYAVINLPSGTKASSVKIGECAYTIPEVGEKVAAKGENTFADGTYYYFIANTPTADCFGCGTYWVGIEGDGTTSGEVTATGHVLPSVKCEATELATIGDDVWYYNGDNVKTGIFADLAVYNKSIGTFVINMDSATIGDTGISPNLYGEDSDQPVIRVQLGDSPPHTTSCGATPSTNEMVTIDSFPGGGAIFKMSPVGVMSNTVSGARILMGTDVDGGGLYSFVPFVGSTFLLETLTYNRTTVEGSAPRTALHAKFGNLNAINMEEPFSGLELYADNKYFVYTNVSYDKHDSTDGGKNSPWRLASDYWRTSYDAFGATIDQHTKKIYLKLNHSTGPTTQPLGLTGGGFYMHPYEEDWKYPVGEYVKVVATGFCD